MGFPAWAFTIGVLLFLVPSFIMLLGIFMPEIRKCRNRGIPPPKSSNSSSGAR